MKPRAATAALALGILVPALVPALLLALVLAAPAAPALAGELSSKAGYALLKGFLAESADERQKAARELTAAADASLLPGLVDAFFFLRRDRRSEASAALQALAGPSAPAGERYHDWVQWVSNHPALQAKPGYLEWKASLFARIDPKYREILYAGAPLRLRLEEVVSGGVGVEGIPALDRPATVAAAAATYLEDGERVFGVSVGGEQRAYPQRILSWHEMVNDVVGGRPVALSFCTLCGSAVLFDTARPGGAAPYTFGTSGLLYRSNKLMIDRETRSLWSNLTGEPQVGRLAAGPPSGGPRLPILPVTVTTWKEWRTRHPATTVLALDTATAQRWGFDYRPGAAERKRQGVRFPTPAMPPAASALGDRDEILAVRLAGRAKAYALDAVLKERVVNDRLGTETLVVVGDPASGAARVYRRGSHSFRAGPLDTRADTLVDETGRAWQLTEEALAPVVPPGEVAAGAPEETLARVPAHLAYWFGWYAFFPDSELYGGRGTLPVPPQEVKR